MKSEFIDIDELLLIIKKKDKAPYFLSEIYRIFRTGFFIYENEDND
jgi:hypothetical protein